MVIKQKILFLLFTCLAITNLNAQEENNLTYPLSSERFSCKALASFTYWAPYSGGLNLLVSKGNFSQRGKVFIPKFIARPGFKVLIGGTTFFDNLDVSLEYTWFSNPSTTKEYSFNDNLFYYSPFLENTTYFHTFSSQYENNFNIIKALFEKNITTDKMYIMRLKTGGIALWDFQKMLFNGLLKEDENLQENASLSQNWYSGGPYLSTEISWNFIQNLYFFADAETAILLSSHEAKKNIKETNLLDGEQRTISNIKTNLMDVEPMVGVTFGVRGSLPLDNWIVTLEAAWESQTYFSHNTFLPNTSPMGVEGNYSMQGLTATLTMDF